MDRLSTLTNMLEERPEDSFLIFAIAKEYEKSGDEGNALKWYLRLKESNPEYLGLYYHLGKLYEAEESLDKAKETYQAGIDLAKKQQNTHSLSELQTALTNLEYL